MRQREVFGSRRGHAPSLQSGIFLRPDARKAFAANNASPEVKKGVSPVSLK
jgi:hypothetical protein